MKALKVRPLSWKERIEYGQEVKEEVMKLVLEESKGGRGMDTK